MWKLVPIKPTRKLQQVENAEDIFDQFFENFFNDKLLTSLNKTEMTVHSFNVDIIDAGDKYIIDAEMAGFKKDDVKVEYIDNYLVISAWREPIVETNEKLNYIRKERHNGCLKRSFYVDDIQADKITASFNNGILSITLEKKPLEKHARKIVIE